MYTTGALGLVTALGLNTLGFAAAPSPVPDACGNNYMDHNYIGHSYIGHIYANHA